MPSTARVLDRKLEESSSLLVKWGSFLGDMEFEVGLKGGSIYIAGRNLRHGDRWSKDLVRGGEAHCKSGGFRGDHCGWLEWRV